MAMDEGDGSVNLDLEDEQNSHISDVDPVSLKYFLRTYGCLQEMNDMESKLREIEEEQLKLRQIQDEVTFSSRS